MLFRIGNEPNLMLYALLWTRYIFLYIGSRASETEMKYSWKLIKLVASYIELLIFLLKTITCTNKHVCDQGFKI